MYFKSTAGSRNNTGRRVEYLSQGSKSLCGREVSERPYRTQRETLVHHAIFIMQLCAVRSTLVFIPRRPKNLTTNARLNTEEPAHTFKWERTLFWEGWCSCVKMKDRRSERGVFFRMPKSMTFGPLIFPLVVYLPQIKSPWYNLAKPFAWMMGYLQEGIRQSFPIIQTDFWNI